MKKTIQYILVLGITSIAFGIPLQEMFDSAEPMDGYDKYIILDPDEIYTGSIGIYEDNVFIEGNGAVIDLESGVGIWVYGDEMTPASLDIYRCSIINGADYALSYAGLSTGSAVNCNLINSAFGIKLYDYSQVNMRNCNVGNNTTYGIGIYSTTPTLTVSYCNTWNNGEDYMENCPG